MILIEKEGPVKRQASDENKIMLMYSCVCMGSYTAKVKAFFPQNYWVTYMRSTNSRAARRDETPTTTPTMRGVELAEMIAVHVHVYNYISKIIIIIIYIYIYVCVYI